jgi:hypothetical protein
MSRWTWLGAVALCLVPSVAHSTTIGIFLDPSAGSCAAAVGPNPRIDLHLVVVLEGDLEGITGAQFQIDGIPRSWTPENVLWVPDDGVTISVGNPAFTGPYHPTTPGVNVAYSTCKGRSSGTIVPIGRLVLLGPPTAANVRLRIVGFDFRGGYWNPVPLVVDCSDAFVQYYARGGEIVLNGSPAVACPTAVAQRTWSNVKAMYRN